ncbi:hypothetical protein [Geodermatophilus sp. SYSU D00815]
MQSEAKRAAQDALFAAIQDQAENNMRAALRAPEKAQLLRDLAEAYRLTAGGWVPDVPRRNGTPAGARDGKPADDGARKRAPAG